MPEKQPNIRDSIKEMRLKRGVHLRKIDEPLTVGEVIQLLRERRGFTQAAFAKATKLSINFISLLENNHRGCSHEALDNISKVLGVPPSYFIVLAECPSGPHAETIKEMIRIVEEDLSKWKVKDR